MRINDAISSARGTEQRHMNARGIQPAPRTEPHMEVDQPGRAMPVFTASTGSSRIIISSSVQTTEFRCKVSWYKYIPAAKDPDQTTSWTTVVRSETLHRGLA